MMSHLLLTAITLPSWKPLLPVRHVIWDMAARILPAHARILFSHTHPRLPATWFAGVYTLDLLAIPPKGENILDELLPYVFPRVTHLRVWDLRALPPTSVHARNTLRCVDYRVGVMTDHAIWRAALPNTRLIDAKLLASPAHVATYTMQGVSVAQWRDPLWKIDRVYERGIIVTSNNQCYLSLLPNLGVKPSDKTSFWAPIQMMSSKHTPPTRFMQATISENTIDSLAFVGVHGHGIESQPIAYSSCFSGQFPPAPTAHSAPTTDHSLLAFFQSYPSTFSWASNPCS
jgi:hypothetical protein